jgi:hypothetical protein
VPPAIWIRPRIRFQARRLACSTWPKFQPGISVRRFSAAPDAEVNEIPTFAVIVWVAVVSNVRYSPPGPDGGPTPAIGLAAQVPLAVNGWLNTMSKCSV